MIGPARNVMGGISSVVNCYFETSLIHRVNLTYIESHCDGSKIKKLFKAIISYFKFIYILVSTKIDIVHIHTSYNMSFYRKTAFFLIAKFFLKNIILHVHSGRFDSFCNKNKFNKYLVRMIFQHSKVIIALSNYWKDIFLNYSDNKNVKVIYNPINIEKYSSTLDKKSTEIIFVFMGVLNKAKGVYDLLDVIEKLIIKYKNIKFKLCGNGQLDEVRTIIKKKEMNEYIELTGWIGEKEKIRTLRESDIFVLPSYIEGLPMSILEAMASGLPIISTNIGGIPEAVINGENGFIIEAGDKESLYEKSLLLIGSEELRYKMGNANSKILKMKFSSELIASQLVEVYESIIE